MNAIARPVSVFPKFLILFITILLFLVAWVTVCPPVTIPDYTSHAVDRHSDVISPAVTCFSGSGTISPQMMYNPDTKRSAWMCQLDGGIFIWILDEMGDTVTMFKNKAATFDKAIDYLLRRGYVP